MSDPEPFADLPPAAPAPAKRPRKKAPSRQERAAELVDLVTRAQSTKPSRALLRPGKRRSLEDTAGEWRFGEKACASVQAPATTGPRELPRPETTPVSVPEVPRSQPKPEIGDTPLSSTGFSAYGLGPSGEFGCAGKPVHTNGTAGATDVPDIARSPGGSFDSVPFHQAHPSTETT